MRRDLYENRIYELKGIKQARNKEMLAKEVARMGKQLNQRFYRLEKAGKRESSTAYIYAQQETGRGVPRYSTNPNTLMKLSNEDLYEQALQINKKLISKSSTSRGLLYLANERVEKSAVAIENELDIDNFDRKEFDKFLKSGGGDILNSIYYDSYQVIEDWLAWRKQGLTSKEIIRSFRKYNNKAKKYAKAGKQYEIDMSKVYSDFASLVQKKKEKRKKK